MTGVAGLSRLILRRDRIIMPAWIIVLSLLPVEYVSATRDLYPNDAAAAQYAHSISNNPTFLALLGPVFGTSIGALGAWRSLFAMVFVGLASILTVIRHTRTDEEAGRRELLGATVVGRHAPLAAALLVTAAADLVLGLLVALWMMALGLPAVGSLALGLSWTVIGCVFATIGGLTAQLTQGAGAARGIAIAVLGAAYLVRAAGDAGGANSPLSWLSWVSPIGWMQRLRPFADEQWWVLGPALALAATVTVGTFALSAHRDVGAGMLPDRLGPPEAPPALRSPLALAWRLHRGLLFGWTAGFAVYGLVVGGVAKGVVDMTAGSSSLGDMLRRLGGQSAILDAYVAAVINLLAIAVAAYAVQATLRLRAEETAQRAEPVLATAVGRMRWAASHLAFAILGPTVVLVVFGLCVGLGQGLAIHDVSGTVPHVLPGALVQLPAVWLLSGLTMALLGLAPRAAWGAWVALAACFLVGQLGALVKLDQRVMDISPFTHVPKVPGGSIAATPLVWLAVAAAGLLIVGLVGLRHRDVG